MKLKLTKETIQAITSEQALAVQGGANGSHNGAPYCRGYVPADRGTRAQ